MVQDVKNRANIIEAISNFQVIPYAEVKNHLDIVAYKTRKALGVTLRQAKPSCVIDNDCKD